MSEQYKKGDKIQLRGEVEVAYGISHIGSVYDDEKGFASENLLTELEGRKVKITVEILD